MTSAPSTLLSTNWENALRQRLSRKDSVSSFEISENSRHQSYSDDLSSEHILPQTDTPLSTHQPAQLSTHDKLPNQVATGRTLSSPETLATSSPITPMSTSSNISLPLVPRSVQLEAQELDDGLLGIFLFQVRHIFKYYSPNAVNAMLPELELLLKLIVCRFSILIDKPTPGAMLQKLVFVESNLNGSLPLRRYVRILAYLLVKKPITLALKFALFFSRGMGIFLLRAFSALQTKFPVLSSRANALRNIAVARSSYILPRILRFVQKSAKQAFFYFQSAAKQSPSVISGEALPRPRPLSSIQSMPTNTIVPSYPGYPISSSLRNASSRAFSDSISPILPLDLDVKAASSLQTTSNLSPLSTAPLNALLRPQTKLLYVLGFAILPFAWRRLKIYMSEQEYGFAPDYSFKKCAFQFVRYADITLRVASLANFFIFLSNGKYVSLLTRMLGMQLAFTEPEGVVGISLTLVHQQLFWNALLDFCFYFAPLIPFRAIARFIKKTYYFGSTSASAFSQAVKRVTDIDTEIDGDGDGEGDGKNVDDTGLLSKRKASLCCPICGTTSICTPYITNCGHVYCYYCIRATRMAHRSGWSCATCGELVTKQLPYTAARAVSPG